MTQTVFRNALLDPTHEVPDGLTDADGRPAGRRFAVYRNNVAVSLREALETGFPATAKLLGEQNFVQIAQGYLRAHPPSSPLMMQYGGGFPDYIAAIPALEKLAYLPDVARLEYELRLSYHAEDAIPIAPDRLAALSPEELNATKLLFAPALRLFRTPWPVVAIRDKGLNPDAPQPPGTAQPVLITRPEFDPIPNAISPADAELIYALMQGASLAQALTTAPDADLGAILGLLLAQNAITDLELET